MDNIYKKFYRSFYLRTQGFIPAVPLNQYLLPGDFFQIRKGEILVLGNVFRNGIVESSEVDFGKGSSKLNFADWQFSDGVAKPYSGRGAGNSAVEGAFEFSKQVLSFLSKGSFIFKGNNPESIRIYNWAELQQQLIIKLTQTVYSFRELYVVTECAALSEWTLAISGSDKGELEIATDAENFGLVDIFGHESTKTIQSKDIEYFHRENKRRPSFFKAKKLALKDEMLERFLSIFDEDADGKQEWAKELYGYEFDLEGSYTSRAKMTPAAVLDMQKAGDLHPASALNYFKWVETNLDDVEKFFTTQ